MEKLVDSHRRQCHFGKARHLIAHGVWIELATYGILHPRICHENPPSRNSGSYTRKPCGGKMESARNLLPSEEHDSHECTLHEERHNAFNGKRSTEYVTYKPRIVAPVGAKLKLKDDARSHTHGKVDTKQTLPELGSLQPEGFACAIIDSLDNAHYYSQSKRERHKQPMIDGCKRKLRTRPVDKRRVDGKQMIHKLKKLMVIGKLN